MSMSQKTILMLENDISLIEVMQIILHEHFYQIKTAQSSQYIIRKVHFTKPDIILIDSHILGDGVIIPIHLLKQHRYFYKIPVILMGTNLDIAKMAIAAGADDFINKPFNIDEFESKIFKLINQSIHVN